MVRKAYDSRSFGVFSFIKSDIFVIILVSYSQRESILKWSLILKRRKLMAKNTSDSIEEYIKQLLAQSGIAEIKR